jgi:acyl CoA:acetate/3-ketoacid CoA transferase beta subunit
VTSATRAEICAAACADLFLDDGEIMSSPMGLIPTLGARLAKLTSSPNLLITDGESLIMRNVPALGSHDIVAEGWIPFSKVFDIVANGKRHVVMGASQLDRHGNQNISCIGDFEKPERQLLGVRGAPGNTVNNKTSYWVPRQSPRVFVDRVDVVSGVGRQRATAAGKAATRFHSLHRVVTNLGVYDFGGAEDTLRLISLHPGVTTNDVRVASSCEIHIPDEVPESRVPTPHELALIREVIDPKALRDREVSQG